MNAVIVLVFFDWISRVIIYLLVFIPSSGCHTRGLFFWMLASWCAAFSPTKVVTVLAEYWFLYHKKIPPKVSKKNPTVEVIKIAWVVLAAFNSTSLSVAITTSSS